MMTLIKILFYIIIINNNSIVITIREERFEPWTFLLKIPTNELSYNKMRKILEINLDINL